MKDYRIQMIRKINFEDLSDLINKAKKERVSFANPIGAEWFGIYEDEKLVSFYCLVITKDKARFKSNYTVPEYRGRGYLKQFILHAKMTCLRRGVKEITAYCTPLSRNSHIRYGAKIQSIKKDIVFVKYFLK